MSEQPLFPSHLFTLRVWHVDSDDGGKVWHGRVQYVYSNEVHEFDDWSALIAYVQDTATRSSAVDGAKAPTRDEGRAQEPAKPGGGDGPV